MKYPIIPVSAPRQTRADAWKKRPCVLRYRAFKDEIRAHKVEIPQPCKIIFYIAMTDSWSAKKKAAMLDQPHQQKPDIDNLLKAVLDSVFDDDCAIWSVWAEKRWSNEGAIEITAL